MVHDMLRRVTEWCSVDHLVDLLPVESPLDDGRAGGWWLSGGRGCGCCWIGRGCCSIPGRLRRREGSVGGGAGGGVGCDVSATDVIGWMVAVLLHGPLSLALPDGCLQADVVALLPEVVVVEGAARLGARVRRARVAVPMVEEAHLPTVPYDNLLVAQYHCINGRAVGKGMGRGRERGYQGRYQGRGGGAMREVRTVRQGTRRAHARATLRQPATHQATK